MSFCKGDVLQSDSRKELDALRKRVWEARKVLEAKEDDDILNAIIQYEAEHPVPSLDTSQARRGGGAAQSATDRSRAGMSQISQRTQASTGGRSMLSEAEEERVEQILSLDWADDDAHVPFLPSSADTERLAEIDQRLQDLLGPDAFESMMHAPLDESVCSVATAAGESVEHRLAARLNEIDAALVALHVDKGRQGDAPLAVVPSVGPQGDQTTETAGVAAE